MAYRFRGDNHGRRGVLRNMGHRSPPNRFQLLAGPDLRARQPVWMPRPPATRADSGDPYPGRAPV